MKATILDKAFGVQKGTYYDPRSNCFVTVHKARRWRSLCGEFCSYYEDSRATTGRQYLSYDYLLGCERVFAVDQCNHAYYDGFGWKVITREVTNG